MKNIERMLYSKSILLNNDNNIIIKKKCINNNTYYGTGPLIIYWPIKK